MIKYNSDFLFTRTPLKSLEVWQWLTSSQEKKLKIGSKNGFKPPKLEPKNSYLIGELPRGTEAEKFMYLKLSSLRNYFDYIESKEVTLPLVLGLRYYSKLQILTNRLLNVKDEKIYFKNEK